MASQLRAVDAPTPAQALCERLLAMRDKIATANDTLAAVLASVHGREPAAAERSPRGAVDYKRFFPAMERLVKEIETEADRYADHAAELDRSF